MSEKHTTLRCIWHYSYKQTDRAHIPQDNLQYRILKASLTSYNNNGREKGELRELWLV